MLEVLPEEITASPRSVPLGVFDSRKCKFSFGEKFLDTSVEDSLALPVFTPRNFWRCAYQNEVLVQCNHNFSCLDSELHCLMIVCEGSVIRESDSDQLWHVLEVTPHGILALGGTVQEFDFLRHFEIDGSQWTQLNIGDWQDWSAIAVRGVHPTFVRREYLLKPEHLCPALHGVIYDSGCAPFQKLLEFSAERGFPNCGAWHLGKLVTELDIPYAGCEPRSLSGLLALLMTWALPHWTEQQIEEVIHNRGVKVHLHESLATEAVFAAADDIFDADEAEGAMEEAVTRRVAKTKSEAREAKRKSTAVVKASAPPKTVPHATATTESSGPSTSSSSSAAANAPSTSRAVVRFDKDPHTLQEARALIPAVKGCSLCIASSGNAWQIRYLYRREPPRSRQVTRLGERNLTSKEALFECLRWAWDEFQGQGLVSCPHDFNNM